MNLDRTTDTRRGSTTYVHRGRRDGPDTGPDYHSDIKVQRPTDGVQLMSSAEFEAGEAPLRRCTIELDLFRPRFWLWNCICVTVEVLWIAPCSPVQILFSVEHLSPGVVLHVGSKIRYLK